MTTTSKLTVPIPALAHHNCHFFALIICLLLATLTPGAYTAIVRGQNNTTGVALVEAYNLQ